VGCRADRGRFARGKFSLGPIEKVGPELGCGMGWSYRKSVNLGPFRVNLSKSGIGYSVGEKDLRVGVDSRGRRYTEATIPGTGLHYRSSKKGKGAAGCAPVVLIMVVAFAAAIGHFVFTN